VRDDVQRGLGEIAKRNLPYDLLIRPPHLEASLQLAQNLPELLLDVNHIAKPVIKEQGWDDWAAGMKALGDCENVYCKVSGMITEADWANWKPEDLAPYIDHVIDVFGPDRLMFGTDWPVCTLAGTYTQVTEALEVNTTSLSDSEREALFGGTAERFYKLKNH
jgi:L-fuconolactonase